MRAFACLLLAVLSSGCVEYWVDHETLARARSLPRDQRRFAVVNARRGGMEPPAGPDVLIRAGDATPCDATSGTWRKVRVNRPQTITGTILAINGAALLVIGVGTLVGMIAASPYRAEDGIGLAAAGLAPAAAIGGAELIVGISLVGVGRHQNEVKPDDRRFFPAR